MLCRESFMRRTSDDGFRIEEVGACISVERYGKRFWAVYEAGDLLCVTVYKRGAQAVKARLDGTGGGRVENAMRLVASFTS